MKVEITVPAVGESVSEAVVAQIIKENGSSVKKDDEILELETDKVNQVIHAPESGVLSLTVKAEDKVGVGQVIGHIETSSERVETTDKKDLSEKKEKEPQKEQKEAPKPKDKVASQARISEGEALEDLKKHSEKPQDLSKTQETKPSKPQPSVPQGQERKRMSGLRRTIAKKLVEAKNQTAMLTTFNEVDMTEIMQIRATRKDNFEKKFGVKLGFLSFFVRACSSALKAFPDVNAFIEGDDILYNSEYNIGIAVSTDKGLMVPVLRNCENMTFADIEQSVAGFAKKAREGSISIDDLQGGTFTITNGGVFGSLLSTPILNPPQSAILGMHKIMKRAVVVDDKIDIRPMMYLALSYDHRIIDGKEAVSFLVHVKECLENPSKMLLDA